MGAFRFGIDLLRLHAGADFERLRLRREDHNGRYEGPRKPLSVTLSCTYRCNLKCIHCQAENDNAKDDIPEARMLSLIDEIAAAGATKVGFTGGEPLIRKDFPRLLRRCRERGLVSSVVANSWLVERNIEALKDTDLLFLSVDGDREIHDRIRGPGNWDKFLQAAKAAREAGIPVCVLTTLMKDNFHCIAELSRMVADMGLHWMVGLIQSGFTERTDQDVRPAQLHAMLAEVAKSRNLRTSKRYLRFVEDGAPMDRCWAGIGYCIVAPNGRLYPCFPAQFDHEAYDGVAAREEAGGKGVRWTRALNQRDRYEAPSVLEMPFQQAWDELKLYRRTCDTCALACHAEANFLYDFDPAAVRQSFRLLKPA